MIALVNTVQVLGYLLLFFSLGWLFLKLTEQGS